MKEREVLERIYAGFIGMNAGIRLGAPVEPTVWSSERIERFYGDITSYVKPFRNFAADDDANGPVFFLRSLDDKEEGVPLTAGDVAEAWLNYAREGIGMFWWGGYGVSTEHTAYLNLKNGVPAPLSGSEITNGKVLSEQIGGQIFVDTWGLINPGNPKAAAESAKIAASVSHDGEGLEGAAFVSAAIAEAFVSNDIERIVDVALSFVSDGSIYKKVAEAVISFHKENPDSWRACLSMLQSEWGYDKYKGVCHIIPNAGVVVMSLLYGRHFKRGIEIATMAGWDTDCNAGNVGTILGVMDGLDGLGEGYRAPINDMIVLSGVSGYLNVLDIPTYAKKLTAFAMINMGIIPSDNINIDERHPSFDFSLPGSTHGLRLSDSILTKMRHVEGKGVDSSGALEILFDRMVRGQKSRIYYKSFWRREDFDDERYMPVFSPTVYPGENVEITFRFERFNGEGMIISPYVKDTFTKEIIYLGGSIYKDEDWHTISFTVPQLNGSFPEEVGIVLESNSPSKFRDFGVLYISSFSISGKSEYSIDFSRSTKEFASVLPFSHDHGAWEIVDGRMEEMSLSGAEAYTGNYFTSDVTVEGGVVPYRGESHLVGARIQGARRGYYGGIDEDGFSIIKKRHGKKTVIAHKKANWEYGREYGLTLSVIGDEITLSVDNEKQLTVKDDEYKYGMVGYGELSGGRRAFCNMKIKEM